MRRVLACTIALALAACATDPLPPPALPVPSAYTATPVEGLPLAPDAALPAQWWTLFRSPALDALVRQALDASPTLARAQAKLREAQEHLEARTGATRYPQVDAKLSANRVDLQPQALGVPSLPVPLPFELYLASVSVSYRFDFAGGQKRELEALQAEVDRDRYQLEAARLMLAGNVVTAAIREAALQAQVAGTRDLLALQAQQLAITERLEAIGTVTAADAATRRSELAQARASLPGLQRELERVRHRLAVYLGQSPAAAEWTPVAAGALRLPEQLPLALPSELARRRPDIRAAEALLQAAAARVGVATANLYPQLTLSATAGTLAADAGKLFGPGSAFTLLGASLAQPLFHGGELQARRRAAIAAYEQASASYREVVLQGLQEVADALRALEADARTLQQRTLAAEQAGAVHAIAQARHRAGGISDHELLAAQRRLQAALLDRTQAAADGAADAAALLQALGGGWWAEQNPR